MTEIVVVFEDEDGFHYKPMKTKTITKAVKSELKKNKDAIYSICQTAKLTPKTDEETGEPEEPDENGYYDQDQIDYEMVGVGSGGEFVKKPKDKEKYYDWKNKKEIEV